MFSTLYFLRLDSRRWCLLRFYEDESGSWKHDGRSYITNFKHNLKYNTTHKTRISNGYKNRTKVYLFSLKNENLKFVLRLVRGFRYWRLCRYTIHFSYVNDTKVKLIHRESEWNLGSWKLNDRLQRWIVT